MAPLVAGLGSAVCLQSNLTTGTQASGAQYVLYMPESSCWNGDVVVYAHGYVQPGVPLGIPQDQLSIGSISLPGIINLLGYAFAASTFSKNGLAIVEGVNDTRDLVQSVLNPQLNPNHVYLIGVSEGGLVTALSAEQFPNLYNSAGAACGPIGSFQSQLDYLDDFRVIFDYFFPGVIPGNALNIPPQVMSGWESVYVPAITAALAANPQAASQLIKVTQAAVTTDPATIAETAVAVLWYNVFGTADAVAALGGQPYDNHDRVYSGSSNDTLLNQKVERYTASPVALAAVAAHYETTGRVHIPLLTIHTTGDPVIPYWHEILYTAKTLEARTFLDRLDMPVPSYGHCVFSAPDVLAAFSLIVLRDRGMDLSTQIRTLLAEPERREFDAAMRRARAVPAVR